MTTKKFVRVIFRVENRVVSLALALALVNVSDNWVVPCAMEEKL
jgi:hypothetical protein